MAQQAVSKAAIAGEYTKNVQYRHPSDARKDWIGNLSEVVSPAIYLSASSVANGG